ncbi:MAG TPA: cyclic nucleotide-binding domain-containing protein, partial [Kofleriaceae bacterium]|nr:cyclic nucleotide-binding domain-containing protein [Kofleriaceae bacterium]
MAADPAFLAQISLFQQLDDDERTVLAGVIAERSVQPGDVLFRAGEPGDAMYIVQSGKVELFVKDKAGQKITLHTAEAGEFFGELSLLDGGSRTATAQITEAGTMLMVDREDLQQLFRKRPDAALDMLAAMG